MYETITILCRSPRIYFAAGNPFPSVSPGAGTAADGSLYLLFNTHIRKSTWLTARTIDAHGTPDIDLRICEDVPLGHGDKEYRYLPCLAITVGAGGIIVPCRKAQTLYLARVNLHATRAIPRVTE